MRKLSGARGLVLCITLLGCNTPTPATTKAPADRSVDEGFFQAGGAVVRCRTTDGGFTTICRTP